MLQQLYPQVQHTYRFELNKDFQFAAAHFIPHPSAGACANVHGHTYFCNLTVAGNELDVTNFLVNFGDLKKLVHKRFDHTLINEVEKRVHHPSTEAMAELIWTIVQDHLDTLPHKPKCLQVFLRETPTSYVVYRPDNSQF